MTTEGNLPVLQAAFYPMGTRRPNHCPIVKNTGVLELKTAKQSRFYGCDNAYINSELRMVVVGCNDKDEVRMKWPICSIQ
jgi:hypothetical protein